jgi:hypothetical protein
MIHDPAEMLELSAELRHTRDERVRRTFSLGHEPAGSDCVDASCELVLRVCTGPRPRSLGLAERFASGSFRNDSTDCKVTRRGRPRAEPSTNWDSEEPSLCDVFFVRPSDIPMSLARRSRQLAGPAWGTEELLGRRPGLSRLPAGGGACRGKGERRLDPANVFGAASRGRRDHESFRRESLTRDLVDRLKQLL